MVRPRSATHPHQGIGPMSTQVAEARLSSPPKPAAAAVHWQFVWAWLFVCVFYFLQYALRSAPGVMMPELISAFGLTALGVSSLLGLYFYTYSVFGLVAGASLDRYGAKLPIAIGVFCVAAGSVLFGLASIRSAEAGRLLQGAGSAFAFTGAVYLAAHGFSARWLATAIGVTQCLGMLGGAAGQFVVGPLLEHGVAWQTVWHWLGTASIAVGVLMFAIAPREPRSQRSNSSWASVLNPYLIVFRNPQSYLCGAVAGLLFVPTTIGDMTWGVAFFQRDRMFSYHDAVVTGSLVPLGWVFGCPLLGWLDRKST